jgi:hypothetical protein
VPRAALKDIYRIRMTVVARVEHARRGHIKHVYFVWVCPDMEHAAWFTDVINDCLQVLTLCIMSIEFLCSSFIMLIFSRFFNRMFSDMPKMQRILVKKKKRTQMSHIGLFVFRELNT